jgi:hypothetical protein
MLISRSRSFRHKGFTFVNPRNGFVYKILGNHAHEDIIRLIKLGEIPLSYLKTTMPAGNHESREHIIGAFEDKDAKCHS